MKQSKGHSLSDVFLGLHTDEPLDNSSSEAAPHLPIAGVTGTQAGNDEAVQCRGMSGSSSSSNESSLQELFCCPLSKVSV